MQNKGIKKYFIGFFDVLFALIPQFSLVLFRGVINDKAGKAAAWPKFSHALTQSQSGGGILCQTIGFASPKKFRDNAPDL